MESKLKYVPIFRLRQEEQNVLKSFDFREEIYPCIEVIKEIDNKKKEINEDENQLSLFSLESHRESKLEAFIKKIKSVKVFVDLPTHLDTRTVGMEPLVSKFVKSIAQNRIERTNYFKRLTPISQKVIPVISTFSQITGEADSIVLQEKLLRPDFPTLAYRTFLLTFSQDFEQIKRTIRPGDYIIMDWEQYDLDLENDPDQKDIVDVLKKSGYHVIVHRNPFPLDISNKSLEHGQVVGSINNNHLVKYREFAGFSFSDYVAIKKDQIKKISKAIISPGFIFYDAVENIFYGYRYKYGSHKKGEPDPQLEEFETTIVPAVLVSDPVQRMKKSSINYLSSQNVGWKIINNIAIGKESGKQQAKFKRISMEHYLHCVKQKIINGAFG